MWVLVAVISVREGIFPGGNVCVLFAAVSVYEKVCVQEAMCVYALQLCQCMRRYVSRRQCVCVLFAALSVYEKVCVQEAMCVYALQLCQCMRRYVSRRQC